MKALKRFIRWLKSLEYPCLGCEQMVDGYGNNCRCVAQSNPTDERLT